MSVGRREGEHFLQKVSLPNDFSMKKLTVICELFWRSLPVFELPNGDLTPPHKNFWGIFIGKCEHSKDGKRRSWIDRRFYIEQVVSSSACRD